MKLPFEIPGPLRIGTALKEYEAYQVEIGREPETDENYGLLSDFSHPNAACLFRYQAREEMSAVTRFIDPDQDPRQESFLPFVNCCLIDLLIFLYELLGMDQETAVRPKVKFVLDELVKLAPRRLTTSIPA